MYNLPQRLLFYRHWSRKIISRSFSILNSSSFSILKKLLALFSTLCSAFFISLRGDNFWRFTTSLDRLGLLQTMVHFWTPFSSLLLNLEIKLLYLFVVIEFFLLNKRLWDHKIINTGLSFFILPHKYYCFGGHALLSTLEIFLHGGFRI